MSQNSNILKDEIILKRNLKIAFAVLFVIAITTFVFYTLGRAEEKTSSVQQTSVDYDEATNESEIHDDKTSSVKKTATIPDLASFVGTDSESLSGLVGHGAQVLSDEVKEGSENGVARTIKFTLANDEGDAKTGNPTIVFNVDGDGIVLDCTYLASIKTLGYGTLSFRDAILNAKIIIKAMDEAGVVIDEQDVNLPSDRTEYSYFTNDSKRVLKEEKTFFGVGKKNGDEQEEFSWSSTLTYDYSASIENDNLEDTIRTISITVEHR